MSSSPSFDPTARVLRAGEIAFGDLVPLIDGQPLESDAAELSRDGEGWRIAWPLEDGSKRRFTVTIARTAAADGLTLSARLEGGLDSIQSIGLRIANATNVVRYLRNGYTSWDGSAFVEAQAASGAETDAPALVGHAVTALVSRAGETAVLGYLRHDRFQSRFRFAFAAGSLSIDAETLIDGALEGEPAGEALVLLVGTGVEETLRRWARLVVAACPLPVRVRERRLSGWCSWYSLYASIGEPVLLEHLRAAARFRDRYGVPFEVFQIDDGFTPEMGDWLDVKPQFPRGMKPLLEDIRAAGFIPGLWIAPWMVGNRSRLYAEHPDWILRDAASGQPLVPMTFYGEFRWHKRSEEYYVLDVTNPDAERYIREVLRVWTREWGCGYLKTDFMYFGSEYGPDRARWHVQGLSRMQIWMRMARLIREAIGDALWMSCGGPIWAPIGLVDAVRIARDIGVSWHGNYSAESLLRDETARNFANGIFWQADPDCILLRERFHHLTGEEVRSLAMFAGLAGGVLMTSDQLDEVPEERREWLAELVGDGQVRPCDFPLLLTSLSEHDRVIVQRVARADGTVLINVLNAGEAAQDALIDWSLAGCGTDAVVRALHQEREWSRTAEGVRVSLPRHGSVQLLLEKRAAR